MDYELNVGDTRACVNVIILNDNLFEFSETFMGQITSVETEGGIPLGEADSLFVDTRNTEITITDNDGK